MKSKDKVKLIRKVIDAKIDLDANMEALAKLVGRGMWNEPLVNSVYHAFEAGLDALAIAVGDDNNWLNWFVYENNCGRSGLCATCIKGATTKPVDTVERLVAVMEGRR